jgi:YfiH family protein
VIVAETIRADARAAAAGFNLGFTTKAEGSMHAPEARARVLEKAGLGAYPAYTHKQVHGSTVLPLSKATSETAEADGWLVDAAGKVALVYAADCTPIFIWDKQGEKAAVLHSGWKGTFANIAAEGVKALGLPPERLEAWIGPRAGACCYSVSEDFAEKFRPESLERRGEKLYFDLGKEAKAQLVGAGVSPDDVLVSPDCTICSGEFFSYRRLKDGLRMIGFLAKKA